MKTLSKLLMVAFVIAAASCQKDDPAPAAPTLIGAWSMSSRVSVNCTEPLDNENVVCATSCEIFTFSDSQLNFYSESGIETLSYVSDESTITVIDGTDATVINYTLTATTLTLTFAEDNGCDMTITMKRL